MLANELYDKCAEYPEYAAVRHFSLQRMAITLRYSDIKFSSKKVNGQPSLDSIEFVVDIAPDYSARTDIAHSGRQFRLSPAADNLPRSLPNELLLASLAGMASQ